MVQRVLLAEDEPNIVTSLSFLLKRSGYEVDVCVDGRAALQAAMDTQPDLLILDVMLPEIDGFEVLRQLRADSRGADLPVIILTAKGQRQDRARAEEGKADLFMTKPFSNAELLSAVRDLVEGERARADCRR